MRTVRSSSKKQDDHGGVGLLHRLSLDGAHLTRIYEIIRERGVAWDDVLTKLFGTISKDEFLGYGTREYPGHDSLGRYPLFRDQDNREYFDGHVQRAASATPFSSSMSLVVRLPRHIKDLDFPEPGRELKLRACKLPLLPYYWSMTRNQMASLSTNELLMAERFDHMVRVMDDPHAFDEQGVGFPVLVKEVAGNRRATAVVTLHPSDAWWSAYVRLSNYRLSAWAAPVTDLILSVPRVKDLDEICHTLHGRLVLTHDVFAWC